MAVLLPPEQLEPWAWSTSYLASALQDPQVQGVGWEMRNQEVRRGQRSNKGRSTGQDREDREGEEGAGQGPGQRLEPD